MCHFAVAGDSSDVKGLLLSLRRRRKQFPVTENEAVILSFEMFSENFSTVEPSGFFFFLVSGLQQLTGESASGVMAHKQNSAGTETGSTAQA